MPVGVHDHPAVHVARGAADGLDQRASARRKPSLSASRIATSDTSGRSSPSRSRLMPDQHVELAEAQVAQDLDALERVDVGVQVAHAHAELGVVLGQVLGHALGQRRDQHALVRRHALADLAEQIVDLPADRPHLDLRIEQPGRADDLLDDHALRSSRARSRPASPRRRSPGSTRSSHSSNLSGRLSSADGRRKPYSTSVSLRERSPRYIAADLRHRLVRLVDDQQEVLREVVDQRRRRLARLRGPRGGASSSRCRCRTPSARASRGRTSCAARAAAPRRSFVLVASSSSRSRSSSLIGSMRACRSCSGGVT